jgi:hypothetical protein
MQIFQSGSDLGCVEAGVILVDTLARTCLQCSEKFPTTTVFHAEVKIVFGLERVIKRNDEWVVARS